MEPLQKLHVVDVVDYDVEKSSHHHQSDDEEQKSSSSESGSSSEIMKESRSSMSEVDLERVVPEIKVHLVKIERDCRICHLSLDAGNLDSGLPIELGCSCKDDLASAHKHCAEAWFKIKGNKLATLCLRCTTGDHCSCCISNLRIKNGLHLLCWKMKCSQISIQHV
ncbi:uncharacterized protein LOC110619781 isoform X6 [Manihot esculenta]|uniref:uncharacterized protein LOC110619781 isoform X6 n=1 Tax=Manihot esculenta TaxID=3983 RepID=UPI000B5D0F9D|nr:uncharacterized protein LOC110619781 isoform X6 [Manihot esculenta]